MIKLSELSNQQKKAIKIIESSNAPIVILTGKAGAGKSTVINSLLIMHPSWLICSTTARSALHVGGSTVDHLFCMDRNNGTIISQDRLSKNIAKNYFRFKKKKDKKLVFPEVIIIDEASMLSDVMFNCIVNVCSKHNIKLVLVGDFGQAPPVDANWLFAGHKEYVEKIQMIKLTECHRQETSPFLDELNKVRSGDVDEETQKLFETRVTKEIPGDDYIKLFYRNVDVKKYNKNRLALMLANNPKVAKFTPSIEIKDCNKKYINLSKEYLEKRMEQAIKNSGYATSEDVMCKGCKVVITKNDTSVENQYVNGDTGILVSFDADSVRVKLDRNNVFVDIPRAIYAEKEKIFIDVAKVNDLEMYDVFSKMRDTPITKMELGKGQLISNGKVEIYADLFLLSGFPIKLGYAVTIHFSQGMTLNKAYINLDILKHVHQHGIAYVALSRVKSIDGLLLSSWNNNYVCCDPQIRDYL